MYPLILGLHNILRYVIVVLAVILLVRAISGWMNKRAWDDSVQRFGTFYTMALDTQFLLGLLLYFAFSPLTKSALADFGAVMSQGVLRFFALEHPLYMLIAIGLGHAASTMAKKDDFAAEKRYQRVAVFTALSVVFIILGHLGAPMLERWVPFLS